MALGAMGEEHSYEQRSDSIETKLRLLAAARQQRDYALALAVADSIKDGVEAEWRLDPVPEPHSPVVAAVTLAADGWQPVTALPPSWRDWAAGWDWCQAVSVEETAGLDRTAEPVEVAVSLDTSRCASLARELRVALAPAAGGPPRAVPCQVYAETRTRQPAPGQRLARLVWQATVPAHGRATYLVFAGNPAAELPAYASDLETRGEGYALDIENAHFVASLSRQMGQLERLRYKRAHGLELYAGGEGHGEPPGIDWAHDYLASGKFQKFRVTNWAACRNFQVTRGPVCTIVRRWGFPHSPLHPVFTAPRMLVDASYVFYAGQPYLLKRAQMRAVQDFSLNYLRDDEWVFSGYSFTDLLWMDAAGQVREGKPPPEQADAMWGVGLYHRQSRDAFFTIRLDHRLDGPSAAASSDESRRPVLRHADGPNLDYRGHGQLWSRWALRGDPVLRAGDTLHQYNAYLVEPYAQEDGAARLEAWRRRLLEPLRAQIVTAPEAGTFAMDASPVSPGEVGAVDGALARPGETPAARPRKAALWEAMREVQDDMFYTVDANVVDMGYIYDLRLREGAIEVLMTMPHRGRPLYRYLGNRIEERLRREGGADAILIQPVWDPPWTPARMSEAGGEAMGLAAWRA